MGGVSSILESLTLELGILRSLGVRDLVLTFGNTGELALRKAWGIEGRCVIQTGNYPGHVLDEAARMEFRRGLFCAHPGKLLKVAAGSFNTKQKFGIAFITTLQIRRRPRAGIRSQKI